VLNWFAYSSPALDGVAKKLSTELDESTRSTLAIEAQKILNDDVPVIVLAEPKFVLAIRSDITGVLAEPDALLRLRKLVRQ
jgi:ABC-type transport system substrate-binding protein